MNSARLNLGIIFLSQTGIGLVGNSSLLFLSNRTLFTEHHLRPTDLVLNQLVLVNSMVLFSKGVPQTLETFGWKHILGDSGCKLVFYLYRVGTGVSFSTVCLFSGFQAIKLDPSICRWLNFKIKSIKFSGFCCFLCWIPHVLINSFIPLIVNGALNTNNLSVESNYEYCSWVKPEGYSLLFIVLYFFPNLTSLLFIIWASGSMILFLHRHKQRVQHIHSHSFPSRPSREARAQRTILILVSSFITFYFLYTILTIWMTLVANQGQWMVSSSVLVASCFPEFSPFVLIISDSHVSRLWSACMARKKDFA
ncbi:vomeronasal type-1 receptor 1-like [Ctenodactylus gundi]